MSSSRPLSLHEIASLLEDEDFDTQDNNLDVFLMPPEYANDDHTDEDSGDDDNVTINNLPPTMLRAPAELSALTESTVEEQTQESTSDPPQPSRKRLMKYKWRKQDINMEPTNWKPMHYAYQEKFPLEWFSLFFTDDLFDLLVTETNRYLERKLLPTNINIEEMKCLIGILLVSGYSQVNRRRMYWENAPDCRNSLIASALSRDRFTLIFSNLHVADNMNLDASDKFSKVRPLLKKLSEYFLEHCPHKENHSVDEAMVPYFGRHGCKQFIRGKPIRYGYKLWVGATSEGYIAWFEPYQGASTMLNPLYSELGLGAGVVLTYVDKLAQRGYGKHYHIFVDIFFTGLPLVQEMTKRGALLSTTKKKDIGVTTPSHSAL